jgi:hypothetical protein
VRQERGRLSAPQKIFLAHETKLDFLYTTQFHHAPASNPRSSLSRRFGTRSAASRNQTKIKPSSNKATTIFSAVVRRGYVISDERDSSLITPTSSLMHRESSLVE